jgi:hypothetical protein
MLSSLDALLLETMAAASEIRGRWGDSRGRWLQGRWRWSSRRRRQRFLGGGGRDSQAGGDGDSGDADGGGGEARRRRSPPAARTAMSGWGTGGASQQRAGSSQPVTLTGLYPVRGHVTLNGGSSLSVCLSKLGQFYICAVCCFLPQKWYELANFDKSGTDLLP